jgi:UPF0755 protein
MRIAPFIFSFLFILIAVAIGGCLYVLGSWSTPGPLPEEKEIIIPQGASVAKISSILSEENVIEQPLSFKIAARLLDKGSQLKAGEYLFPEHISLLDTLDKLHEGSVLSRYVTIPEGLTSYQIVGLLNDTPHLTDKITDIPPEGSLLPETYSFTRGDSRLEKIARMQEAMTKTLDELWESRAKELPFTTKEEAITLASIVEKETGVPSERARIAGVFVNRLKAGIALQTDPTVIYALTGGKPKDNGYGPIGRRLLRKDLGYDSPYNTYKYPGLPPGPICNPGAAAIAATLNPEEHDYIYFVADGTGGHVFSKTLDEHNRNAAKWRKIRAAQ